MKHISSILDETRTDLDARQAKALENIKLSKRLLLSYGGIVRHNFERGTMTPGDWSAYNQSDKELRQLPIFIDDSPGVDVRHIS